MTDLEGCGPVRAAVLSLSAPSIWNSKADYLCYWLSPPPKWPVLCRVGR